MSEELSYAFQNATTDYSKTKIYEQEYENYKNSMREIVENFNLTKRSIFVKYDLALPAAEDGTYKNRKIRKIVDYLKARYENKKHKALLYKLLLIRCSDALIYPDELIFQMAEKYKFDFHSNMDSDVDIDKVERTTQRYIKKARYAREIQQDINKLLEQIDNEFEIELPDNGGFPFFGCIEDEIED
jgi:type I site-specific restriction-modification system R (restriction) subunit